MQRRGRCNDLYLYPSILILTPGLLIAQSILPPSQPTLLNAPTISGILILATLPVEMMTTRKMPSGISGLYRLLSNGFVGFIMIDRAWT